LSPDVRSRSNAKTSYQSSRQVGENVTKKISGHDNIKTLRSRHQLHTHIVDDVIIDFNLGIFRCNHFSCPQEGCARLFENVRFMNEGHTFTAVAFCILEARSYDALTSLVRNTCNSINYTQPLVIVFEPCVQPLGVFPDHDEIHILVGRRNSLHALARSNACEEIKVLAQLDVHAAKPFPNWSRN